MAEYCFIPDLASILHEINEARVKAGEVKIKTKNWSSTLSSLTSNPVKQHWITVMLSKNTKKGIPRINTIILLVSINELRKKYNLKIINENIII